MKLIHELESLRRERGELIAGWGEAELVRHLDGRYAGAFWTVKLTDSHGDLADETSELLHSRSIPQHCFLSSPSEALGSPV